MQANQRVETQLHELAIHLGQNRESILTRWRQITQSDSELETSSALSRSQLNDHIPDILDAFEKQVSELHEADKLQSSAQHSESGAGHGLHRWQQGYQLREVMREWRHLHLCLLDELEHYEASHTDLEPQVMTSVRRTLAMLCSDGVCESAEQYAKLQQAEAASRVRDLQIALKQFNDLERLRAEALREAAHDLRGNVGVVKNVSAVLNHDHSSQEMKAECASILETSIESLHAMLEDLMSLSRLEAGHERNEVASFDATRLLTDLCTELHPIARARNLFLKTKEAEPLLINGDAMKIRRIVQNLVNNALKYTEQGGVMVNWGIDPTAGTDRWVVCVQDTGPGFRTNAVTPFARVLKRATDEAQLVEEKAGESDQWSAQTDRPPTLASLSRNRNSDQLPGEGIGLLIVKRLCDLLDASLELETEIGRGTTFRVILPRSAVGK